MDLLSQNHNNKPDTTSTIANQIKSNQPKYRHTGKGFLLAVPTDRLNSQHQTTVRLKL